MLNQSLAHVEMNATLIAGRLTSGETFDLS